MRTRLALLVSGSLGTLALLHCSSSNSASSSPDGGTASTSNGSTVPDAGGGAPNGYDASGGGSPTGGDGGASAADAAPPLVPCTANDQCGDAATAACCAGYCTDTSRDPKNCGTCGNACSSSQFCTGTACDDAVLANVCANPRVTVVLDPYSQDDDAGSTIGQALVASCSPAPTLRNVSQDAVGILSPATGAPFGLPGDTFVAGGGSYGQRIVGYMDTAGQTPVMLGSDGVNDWFAKRATMAQIVNVPVTDLTSTHDYFLVELAIDGASGTLCTFGIGMFTPGTLAASVYAKGELIPNRASYTDSWYVYEWTDSTTAGTQGVPDMSDTFTLIDHGQ
jgi:hypothetical protein